MNKKILIALAVVLLLGGGYYFMKSQKAGVPGIGSTGENSSGVKSLKELIAGGVAQRCTFSTVDESGSSEGTTYVAGGKMRGDFTTTSSGKTTASHMIVDGNTNYIWMDGEKTGFKTTIEETAETGDTPVTQDVGSQGGVSLDQRTDYKCSAWITDLSQFTPPATVQFTDLSQIFNPSSLPVSYP